MERSHLSGGMGKVDDMKILCPTDTYDEKREYCFNGILGLFSRNAQVWVPNHQTMGPVTRTYPYTDSLNNFDTVCTNLMMTAQRFPGSLLNASAA